MQRPPVPQPQAPPILDYETPPVVTERGWPLLVIFGILTIIFLAQGVVLPCLCAKGTVKMEIGMGVDLIVVLRVLIAKLRREKGRSWMIYLLVAASSLEWIPMIVRH